MEKYKLVKGILHINSLETDQVTEARIRIFPTRYVLDYEETSEGWEGSHTSMTIDVSDLADPLVKVVRKGPVESTYVFMNHKKTEGFYLLPEGELALEVDTAELKVAVGEHNLQVVLSAWITIQKAEPMPVQIVMDVTWD